MNRRAPLSPAPVTSWERARLGPDGLLGPVGVALGGLWVLARTPVALADMPPEPPLGVERGTAHHSCDGARIQTSYCPPGAYCNYRYMPFVDCGAGNCVIGADAGLCPAPKATTLAATSKADCKGSWEPVCLDRKVTDACVPKTQGRRAPNPPFVSCGAGRCTTSRFVEDCYPTRKELGKTACDGTWEKVCLLGKLEERCVPKTAPAPSTSSVTPVPGSEHATTYVSCGKGRCAVGTHKGACETGE